MRSALSFHGCVWIDHELAKVFQISARDAALSRVEDSRPPHHIHRSADHIGLGKVALDPTMMSEVARQLDGAQAVLLAGPGQAKVELLGYIQAHSPSVAAHIWGVENSDLPTDHN